MSDQEIAAFLEDMTETIEEVAEQLPDHGEFVARLPAKTVTKSTEPRRHGFDLSYGRS